MQELQGCSLLHLSLNELELYATGIVDLAVKLLLTFVACINCRTVEACLVAYWMAIARDLLACCLGPYKRTHLCSGLTYLESVECRVTGGHNGPSQTRRVLVEVEGINLLCYNSFEATGEFLASWLGHQGLGTLLAFHWTPYEQDIKSQ